MGYLIPVLNVDSDELKEWLTAKTQEPKMQKRLVLVIVSIALLLDNMLYMVIVPIIPNYLRQIHAYETGIINRTVCPEEKGETRPCFVQQIRDYHDEYAKLGWLFASKALVQIMVNPFSGTLIDRIGYEIPMIIGLVIMFASTAIFSLGQSYSTLFFARSLQGVGSAFADTSGLAMIADRFTDEHERSKALGIALAFISFGCLVAPPFGSVLFDAFGKPVPFLILSLICLFDGFLVFTVIQPKVRKTEHSGEPLQGTPIWKLFLDPYISVCSGALVMANVSLAFLEPTISQYMHDNIKPAPDDWAIGMVWLPAFVPHVLGVILTVVLMRRYPRHPWLLAAAGLAMEGFACFLIPYMKSLATMALPLCIICFGIALIDTSLLPMLGYLVDTRHVSVYGSVYAIADISYSFAYAFGPIVAGNIVDRWGFVALNMLICFSNLLYSPVLWILRSVYIYKPFGDSELDTFAGGTVFNKDDDDSQTFEAMAGLGGGYGATDVVTASNDYGYGSGKYDGGFGVAQHSFRADCPQPEFPAAEAYQQPLESRLRKKQASNRPDDAEYILGDHVDSLR